MSGWQAIVFDLDDTLYPERQYVLSGFRAVAHWAEERFGWPARDSATEMRELFDQGERRHVFNRWLAAHGVEPTAWIPTLVGVYRRHSPRIHPYPCVRRLLGRLAASYRLGVVTDGYLEVQQRKMAALRLDGPFQAVVYSDAFGRDAWKPSPRPFRAVLDRLGVEPSRAVYVGDNPAKDFLGARRAGMRSVRIRHSGGLHHDVLPADAEHAPDWEIAELGELEPTLREHRRAA